MFLMIKYSLLKNAYSNKLNIIVWPMLLFRSVKFENLKFPFSGTTSGVQLYTTFLNKSSRLKFNNDSRNKLLDILHRYCTNLKDDTSNDCRIDLDNEFLVWKRYRWVSLENVKITFRHSQYLTVNLRFLCVLCGCTLYFRWLIL